MLGEPVARRLCADGHHVRIFTRSLDKAQARFGAEYEVVAGDVENQPSLDAAVQGCQAVHINLEGGLDPDLERRGTENVVRAASKAGIQHITYLSGTSVTKENCWYAGTKAKFEAEAAIRASGVPYTIFQATFFMELLPRFVRGTRASILGTQPHPWHWVAADDYARMVSKTYANSRSGQQNTPHLRATAMDDATGAADLLQHCSPGRQGRCDPLLDGVDDRWPVPRQDPASCLALLPLQRKSRRRRRSGRGQCLARRADDYAGAMVQVAGGTQVDSAEHAAG